jgi:hypothetical protein
LPWLVCAAAHDAAKIILKRAKSVSNGRKTRKKWVKALVFVKNSAILAAEKLEQERDPRFSVRRGRFCGKLTLRRRVDLVRFQSSSSLLVRAAVVGAAVIAVSNAAQASYQGLSAELHTTVLASGTLRSVYRVYANFTDPADRLHSVYGSPTLGPMTLQSRNAADSGFGDAFFNTPGGVTAPTAEAIALNPNAAWDTFVTIGVSVAEQAPYGDQTTLTPGFAQVSGFNYVTSNGGWYVTPTFDHDGQGDTDPIVNPQAEAGFAGDSDLAPRVLLAQLTVNAGEHVAGTVNIVIFEANSGLQGGGTSTILAQQTFTSVPAPSAIALLGISGLIGKRRRR